jgi:protein disulfide-isomerase
LNTLRRITIALIAVLAGATILSTPARADDGWLESYQQALRVAKQQHKMVLIDFTGSDWCPWCIKLHDEVFSTRAFQAYAQKNLVLLKIDFPRALPQSDAVKAQNQRLQEMYGIQGYPTVIVLDPSGQKVGELGYQPGGPNPFIARLNKLK